MGVEPVPVVRLGHRIPGPVGRFEVLENDPRVLVLVGCVTPDVEVPPGGARLGPARPLEPGVLVRGMVQDQLDDHPDSPGVGLPQEFAEVAQGPVIGVEAQVVGDIVTVVTQG